MIPIDQLIDQTDRALEYAKKSEVHNFIKEYTALLDHLFNCLKLTVSTIPTIDSLSNMKWSVIRVNAVSTVITLTLAMGILFGATYIENELFSTAIIVTTSFSLGMYIWGRIKDFTSHYKSFKKINEHERQLLESLSYYITVGQLLKPFTVYAESLIQEWTAKGLYVPPSKKSEDEPLDKLMKDFLNEDSVTEDDA